MVDFIFKRLQLLEANNRGLVQILWGCVMLFHGGKKTIDKLESPDKIVDIDEKHWL